MASPFSSKLIFPRGVSTHSLLQGLGDRLVIGGAGLFDGVENRQGGGVGVQKNAPGSAP